MADEWLEDDFDASVQFEGIHSGKGRGYVVNNSANESSIGRHGKRNVDSFPDGNQAEEIWNDHNDGFGNGKDAFADATNDFQDEHVSDYNSNNFKDRNGSRNGGNNRRNDFGGEFKGFKRDKPENDNRGNRRGGFGGGNRGNRGNKGDGGRNEDEGFKRDNNGEEDKGDKPAPVIYVPPEIQIDETLFKNNVSVGINFDKYDKIKVNVSGENVPQPIESFEDAGLRDLVKNNIEKSGYKKPTPVQKYATPIIMAGRDLMACAQTGSGKTAAFVVPIVNTLLENPTDLVVDSSHCEPQAIIVSPTRELAIQIYEQVAKFSYGSILKSVVVYGGTSVRHQAGKIFHGCHILVATPGRLLDFLDKGRITFSSVRFLVLDEADRMLDMGFLPNIEKMVNHDTMTPCGERQTLMFSATFPEEIQHLAKKFLDKYIFLTVGIVGGACSDVEQTFHEVSRFKKREKLKELLEEWYNGKIEQTLVFVEKKRIADFLAAFLSESDFPTTSIHGDRYQQEREEALADFRSGKFPILVATDVAARGLDIKNVARVVNYDLPKCITDYVHRIGRTGRVGNRGKATSFYDPAEDIGLKGDLVRTLRQANQEVPSWLEDGGVTRSFGPGTSSKFGGEDIRNFSDAPPVEPEEEW